MKIAVIGGGSTYTPELVSGLSRERHAIGVDELVLQDIDAERREVVGGLAARMLEQQGFTRIDPGAHTVQEQIDLFAAADLVVAPHGAALSNLVFSKPGVRILELFAAGYVNHCYWTIACTIPGATYHYLVADGSHSEGRPMTGVLTDIRIPPVRVLEALDRLRDDR